MDKYIELLRQTTPAQWILVCLVMTVTDVCWALYTKSTATDKAFPAACWAVALFVLGAVTVVSYTTNPVLLIPAAVGAFIGTYIAIDGGKKKEYE